MFVTAGTFFGILALGVLAIAIGVGATIGAFVIAFKLSDWVSDATGEEAWGWFVYLTFMFSYFFLFWPLIIFTAIQNSGNG